ncbi:MAG: hypothetical protein LBF69_04810 [Prevotellaceae bacterium]|jgi:hypothetical protein|nr:hypothetical protein [Prevotellaceae bacterium]
MKTKDKEIDINQWLPMVKRHAWWVLLLIIGLSGLFSVNNLLLDIRSAENDVKKRQLGENLLKLFNYLPNHGQDSVRVENIFFRKNVIKDYYSILPTLYVNRHKQDEIKELYPFLNLIPIVKIDSIKDFDNDNVAVLYYKYFDYTALAGADTLRLFPKLYKCIDGSNVLKFRNFQIFSYFCETGLPYKSQILQYQYRKIKNNFYCEKYIFQ